MRDPDDLWGWAEARAWGWAEARATDPTTSHEAADSVRGEVSARLQRLILAHLGAVHPAGLTCSELVARSGEDWNTISPRLKPLTVLGEIHDSGEKRPGPSGRRQIVWKLGPAPTAEAQPC